MDTCRDFEMEMVFRDETRETRKAREVFTGRQISRACTVGTFMIPSEYIDDVVTVTGVSPPCRV